MKERIQKVLSREGIFSRREVESLIKQGKIKVNAKKAVLGLLISKEDLIEVDNKRIEITQTNQILRALMYNKRVGEISSTRDPQGRTSIYESLPRLTKGKWISVGRLDINTSGLMLFTNNGNLANRLMHPSSNLEREYIARIRGKVTSDHIERLLQGVSLDDGRASFSDIQPGRKGKTNQWFAMVIMEGRTREVRRLWESQGLNVARLKRVRFGDIFLPFDLKGGSWRYLTNKEIQSIEHQ